MAIQTINIGSVANDGTGDDLREAFVKVNANFADLNSRVEGYLDGENVGDEGVGLFKEKSDSKLKFKKIVGGDNVTVTNNTDTVTLSTPDTLSPLTFSVDTGSLTISESGTLALQGGQNIQTSTNANVISFAVTGEDLLLQDPAPKLRANLNANTKDINNGGTITASSFIGNVTGLVHDIDIRDLEGELNGSDFGSFDPEATRLIDLIALFLDIDYGTLTAPSSVVSNFGSLSS